jgi:hypothetical protein
MSTRSETSQRWLTIHELLEETGLPYRQLMTLAEVGRLATRRSGGAVLYDAADAERIVSTVDA